ncbi:MAG: hypothetical protein AAFY90_11810 [Pseudomonadota bacterium]
MCLIAFLKSEDGAVTTDWLVLTASLVGMGVMVLDAVASGTNDLGTAVGVQVADVAAAEAEPANLTVCTLDDAGETLCDDRTSGLVD